MYHRTWRAVSQNRGPKIARIQSPSRPSPVNDGDPQFRSLGRTFGTHEDNGGNTHVLSADGSLRKRTLPAISVISNRPQRLNDERSELCPFRPHQGRGQMRRLSSSCEAGEIAEGAAGSLHRLPYETSHAADDDWFRSGIPQSHRHRGAVYHLPQDGKQPRKDGAGKMRRLPQEGNVLALIRPSWLVGTAFRASENFGKSAWLPASSEGILRVPSLHALITSLTRSKGKVEASPVCHPSSSALSHVGAFIRASEDEKRTGPGPGSRRTPSP